MPAPRCLSDWNASHVGRLVFHPLHFLPSFLSAVAVLRFPKVVCFNLGNAMTSYGGGGDGGDAVSGVVEKRPHKVYTRMGSKVKSSCEN